FFTKGEPREGLVVRRMVEEGDWILPKRTSEHGWTIASKPPFFHWLAAVSSELTGGPSEVAIRLPSVVLGVAAVVAVWGVARTVLPPTAALFGAIILATTFEWVRAVSSARVDVALAGGWYLAAWHLGGDAFFRKHVLKENVFRFLGASALKSGHEHGFFYYLPTFAAGFLPWTPLLLVALVAALRDRDVRRDPRI